MRVTRHRCAWPPSSGLWRSRGASISTYAPAERKPAKASVWGCEGAHLFVFLAWAGTLGSGSPHTRHPRPRSGTSAQTGTRHHRRPGEGRGPGAGHGYHLNARYRRTPTFPNNPHSVIPDPHQGHPRHTPHRHPGEGRGPGAGHGYRLNAQYQPTPIPSSPTPIRAIHDIPHTVAPAKAGAQGRGMDTASTPDIHQHPISNRPLPSSPTPIGDLAEGRDAGS